MSNPKAVTATQDFLDTNQYTKKSILKYERIFGHTWVSTGGETTTKEFLLRLNLQPGQRVLDVGCGTGGSAFYMARFYSTTVHAIDLSTNMIDIAQDRWAREDKEVRDKVSFEVADITKVDYAKESYDVIYSRDTILHIAEKEALYRTMLKWLKPGGILFITDYCRGDQEHLQNFINYVKQRGYDLRTPNAYGKLIEAAGFKDVEATDGTDIFVETLKRELKFFIPTKHAFIKDYSEKDYNDIVDGWNAKLKRCANGDQRWGVFLARK